MAGRLAGKTALLTAAGQGIGRATAEAFLAEGARVIATDLDRAKLAGLDGAETHALDVRSTEAVEALVRAVGPVDVLFNCAGYVHHGSILECSEADWDFSFDLNVKSMHRTIRAVLPGMLERGRGSIVNIASGASSVRGIPNRYVYGASKAAVIGLSKAVAADVIKRGVRCNAICPGTIESPLARGAHRHAGGIDETAAGGRPAGLRRPAADGPARHRARGRDAGALSRVRRVELHDGHDPSGRRRLLALRRGPADAVSRSSPRRRGSSDKRRPEAVESFRLLDGYRWSRQDGLRPAFHAGFPPPRERAETR